MSIPMLGLILIIVFIVSAFKLLFQQRYRLPPGPKPWPIIGNLLDVKPLVFRSMAELSEVYGPVMSLWFGSSLNLSVCSSELAKEALKENDANLANRFRDGGISVITNHGKDLVWADYGPHYVKLRKFCTLELFSPRSIHTFRPIWGDEIAAMVKSIFKDCSTGHGNSGGRRLVLREYLKEAALNTITRMVLGKRFADDELGKELKAILADELHHGVSLGIVEHIPWLSWIKKGRDAAANKQKERKERLARTVLEEQRSNQGNFTRALLNLQAKNELREDTVLSLLWDLISAGGDTTAISVEWAMAEVIKNKSIQKRVQEELNHVTGLDHLITESDVSKLRYLQCVVKEVLRLHPPTPLMLPHKAIKDVKIGGYDFPEGSSVHINVWAIARSPENWTNPLEFQPERFLEEDVDVKGNDFRLIPFGSGRRICPGAQLGIDIVTSMLGHLLHHFCWDLPEGIKPVEIDMLENPGLVTYMRTPFEAVATPRLPLHLYQLAPALHPS